ncbi:MFS transporter, partial [Streptomyces sp. SID5475]|nr:MFS transporter [Streptomyces sp. SID5475]
LVALLVTVAAGRVLLAHPIPVPERALARTPRADSGARTAVRAPRHTTRTRRAVLLFGFIAFCTAYGEGALADWGALHLQQDLAAHPGVAAAGYALFALAMTVGRLTGTAQLLRLGRT